MSRSPKFPLNEEIGKLCLQTSEMSATLAGLTENVRHLDENAGLFRGEIREELHNLREKTEALTARVAALEVKASIWGGLSGAAAACMLAFGKWLFDR